MRSEAFGLAGRQANHDFAFEGAEEEIGAGKVGVGVRDGCGVGPVAVIQQAAVVDVAFEDAQVGAGQVGARGGGEVPEAQAACPEGVGSKE